MHVAILIPTIDRIGGAEQQALLLARGLVHRGWHATIIALSGEGGDAAEQIRSEGVEYFSLHMRKGLADPRGWIRLRHWIRLHQPDVIHPHLPHAVLLARWLRLMAPVRVLVETIHSPATGGLLRQFAYRLSRHQPDMVSAVSQAAAKPWLCAKMARETNLNIIPNGIDLDLWKPDHEARPPLRRELGLHDEFVWLAVGRLDPVKDHATLLRAFAKLAGNARLCIAGAGPLDRYLQRLADELCISGRVNFLGFQQNPLPWMQSADAFVLCSRWEGLPMAFLEASACELPSVVSDIAAMRALVPNTSCGPLVPVGDSDALAAAMSAMMRCPAPERRRLGLKIRQSIASRFSLTTVLNQWEDIYRSLLELKPQPTRSAATQSPLRGKTLQLQ